MGEGLKCWGGGGVPGVFAIWIAGIFVGGVPKQRILSTSSSRYSCCL